MIGALLTALFFGITPVCANRAIRLLGHVRANAWRLLVGAAVLGIWAFAFGQGLHGRFWMFFVAGAVGFGLGGISMFRALPLLGAPLASLMVESLAAVAATGLAWAWYGDAVALPKLAWAAVVLAGVAIGLWPYINGRARLSDARIGAIWAAMAGLFQAVSITISRKALISLKLEGIRADLPTAAFQRLLGGLLIAVVIFILLRAMGKLQAPVAQRELGFAGWPWAWVGLNALFGPILGVTCLIWALKTMQPGLVQTIAATAPLISVPFARWLEGHAPPRLYYLGFLTVLAGLSGMWLAC